MLKARTNIQRDNNCTIIMSLLRHNDSAPRMAASAYHPLLSRHRTTGWRSAEGCQCHGGSPRVGGCGEREEWGPKRKSKTTFEYKHTRDRLSHLCQLHADRALNPLKSSIVSFSSSTFFSAPSHSLSAPQHSFSASQTSWAAHPYWKCVSYLFDGL